MSLTVAIHQPEYFPWLGFLDKARRSDVLVLLDRVQFDRSSLQHRARVLGPSGAVWLTIPFIHRFPQRIDEVVIADHRWPSKHWKSLQACYGRAPGFKTAAPLLQEFFSRPRDRVVDVAVDSVDLLLDRFGARPGRVVRATSLAVEGERSALVLAICRSFGATRYLSGRSGASYLDGAEFAAAGIEIVVQRFSSPAYPRAHAATDEETRGVSSLDAWLNLGDDVVGFFDRAGGDS